MPRLTQNAEGFDVPVSESAEASSPDGAEKTAAGDTGATEQTGGTATPPAVSTPPPEPPKPEQTGAAPSVPADEAEKELPESVEEIELPEVDLPSGLVESLELLKEAEALPEATRREKEIKAKALGIIRPHIGRIQQGLPTITIDANDIAQSFANNARERRERRLEMLARSDRDVAELLAEVKTLREGAAAKAKGKK